MTKTINEEITKNIKGKIAKDAWEGDIGFVTGITFTDGSVVKFDQIENFELRYLSAKDVEKADVAMLDLQIKKNKEFITQLEQQLKQTKIRRRQLEVIKRRQTKK